MLENFGFVYSSEVFKVQDCSKLLVIRETRSTSTQGAWKKVRYLALKMMVYIY